jgi:hypothetical protein
VPRFFNLTEARELLPRVERAIRTAVQSKSNHDQAEQALHNLAQRILLMGGILVDRVGVENLRNLKTSSAERLKGAVEDIDAIGCLIKDLDAGLVDFPTLFKGQEVYLCWRMGEPDIQFWHGVHEGFAGRKSIDKHFLDNHAGRPPD